MASHTQEQKLRKRLQRFLTDMLCFGTLKGFRFFTLHLRGREEILVKVVNEISGYGDDMHSPDPLSSSLNSGNIPYDRLSLLLAESKEKSQIQRSCGGHGDFSLPPASPCNKEIYPQEANWTSFLLAAYARYSCPLVWIRSNHARLVKLQHSTGDGQKDCPLRLKSTLRWKDADVKVWHIVGELVRLCTYPPPLNPFAVDMEFLQTLPVPEQLLASGALINCLQNIAVTSTENQSYTAKVFEDLGYLSKLHLRCLQTLAVEKKLPILQDYPSRKNSAEAQHGAGIQYREQRVVPRSSGYTYKYQTGVL